MNPLLWVAVLPKRLLQQTAAARKVDIKYQYFKIDRENWKTIFPNTKLGGAIPQSGLELGEKREREWGCLQQLPTQHNKAVNWLYRCHSSDCFFPTLLLLNHGPEIVLQNSPKGMPDILPPVCVASGSGKSLGRCGENRRRRLLTAALAAM